MTREVASPSAPHSQAELSPTMATVNGLISSRSHIAPGHPASGPRLLTWHEASDEIAIGSLSIDEVSDPGRMPEGSIHLLL